MTITEKLFMLKDEEYKQFVPNLYGLSKYEIMEIIVKQKGYIWETVSFPTVEW